MDRQGHHEVPRIDDTVTPENLHERAEAVAVPDFDWVTQPIEAVAEALTNLLTRHADDRD